MPFREKVAWVSLVSTIVVWSWYFHRVWQAINVGKVAGAGLVTLFFTALPALDAQVRLALGRRLEYKVTEKA